MKHDIYNKFGMCWNKADFSSFSNKLLKDCTYTSFDYFYKLKGKDRLIDYLSKEAEKNLALPEEDVVDIHRGFYQNTSTILKTLKECCIMVKRSNLETVRIITFQKKFGRLKSISGLSPKDYRSIRDIKIK